MFQFTENFTNVRPSGSYVAIPERPIRAKISEVKAHAHASEPGASVAEFFFTVTEAGFEGAARRMRLRVVDGSEKGQKVKALWRAALESVGYTAAQLDTGTAVTIGAANFVGKDCYLFHTPRQEGVANSYDDVNFITPLAYTDRCRALVAGVAASANHAAVTATVTGPATTAAAPVAAPLAAIPQPQALSSADLTNLLR